MPTISGRLSFSVFGDVDKPKRAHRANVADDTNRYLVAFQYRDTSDALIGAKSAIGPYLYDLDGRFVFAYIAETKDGEKARQDYLKGRAFIFLRDKSWRKSVKPALKEAILYLEKYDYFKSNLVAFAGQIFDDAIDICNQNCVFYADVSVCRTGTTDVSVPFPLKLKESAPNFPSDPERFGHISHVLASQIFYFIKDLGHRHQHHDLATDQIVHLEEFDTGDDKGWRDKTLFSIYRRVIETKRQPNLASFSDSLGLIAYADAFSEISKEEVDQENPILSQRGYTPPVYYAKHISDSILSSKSRVERRFVLFQRKVDIIRTTVLSLAGLMLSLVGLLRLINIDLKVTPHPILVFISKRFIVEPIFSFSLILLFVLLVVIAFSARHSDPSKLSITAVRFLQPLSWPIFVGVLGILAVSAGAAFYYLLADRSEIINNLNLYNNFIKSFLGM